MSPRSQPVVNKIVGREICSPKVADLMIGCWRRDIVGIVKIWDGSRRVDGIYPLYLDSLYPHHNQPITSHATIKVLLSQPTCRSKDPLQPQYHWIVLCHDSHKPLCLQTHVLCLALFLVTITSYHTFISQSWRFCLLSAPLGFHCLHTPYCYLFLANWSVRSPALNL